MMSHVARPQRHERRRRRVPIRVGLNDLNAYYDGTQVQIGQNQAGRVDRLAGRRRATSSATASTTTRRAASPAAAPRSSSPTSSARPPRPSPTTRDDPPDYQVGEEINLVGQGPIRNMYNPSAVGDPNCYSSGDPEHRGARGGRPGNHWFYLLAEGTNPSDGQPASPTCNGSTVTGIGIQKASKILYNAMLMKTSGVVVPEVPHLDADRRQEPVPRQLHRVQHGQGRVGRRQRPGPGRRPDLHRSPARVTVTNPGNKSGTVGTAISPFTVTRQRRHDAVHLVGDRAAGGPDDQLLDRHGLGHAHDAATGCSSSPRVATRGRCYRAWHASSRRIRSRPRRSPRSTFPSRRRFVWLGRSSFTATMSPPGSSAGRHESSSRRDVPQALPFEQPESQTTAALTAARERNQAWSRPRRRRTGCRGTGSSAFAQDGSSSARSSSVVGIRRPVAFSGLGLLTVLTVDLAKGLQPVSRRVDHDGRPHRLRLAREPLRRDRALGVAARPRHADRRARGESERRSTRFDISDPERTVYRGSGSVSGFLLSQWSLSEHRGVLRVVSTDAPAWWGAGRESESALTTLRQAAGALVQAGRVGGLGKGERVYAVRFVGDVGYVVTFRQIDPLYTVDLADPDRPRVLGELKIPGYSAYLHPVGEDLLLGIGQDATEEGRPTGTQLSLFDVSDLRRPTRLHKQSLGLGWSAAESDHHAFLHWPKTGLVVVPFGSEAAAFRVGRARGITEAGRIDHDGAPSTGIGIVRSLVVRDTLLTVSFAGVKSSSLTTLAPLGWAPLPRPENGSRRQTSCRRAAGRTFPFCSWRAIASARAAAAPASSPWARSTSARRSSARR